MTDFLLAQSVDRSTGVELAADCAAQLAGSSGHTLGFVYATSPLASAFPEIVAELRARTGIADWAGTVGLGVCATGAEYFDRPAVVALTCRLDPQAFEMVPLLAKLDAADEFKARSFAAIGIVHGDPSNGDAAEVVAALARSTGAYLVGGMTSAERAFPQVAGSSVTDGGVSGVLLGGRQLQVSVGLTQGCSPIGAAHVVSQAQENILVSLDQRPAYEVLREDVGAPLDADPRRWLANIHVALPVKGSDKADYVVRNLVGIGPEQGLVAIGDIVEPGDRVMFVRRDPDSAARDLERMLADLKARTTSAPKAGLYFSCLARGPNLFKEEAHEMKAIARTFGDTPVAGFFGNGEIAHDRLYGYTGVLVLFA